MCVCVCLSGRVSVYECERVCSSVCVCVFAFVRECVVC